jgi:hypothetical protein
MIEWLNQNQGFVMSLLTAVYVIATVVIVIYNRKSIKEMQRSREEESRPYVFAHLNKDSRDLDFYLRIKNYGKTGAIIEQIKINPSLKFIHNTEIETFLKNVVLAPNQTLQFIVLDQEEETMKDDYHVILRYISTGSKKIQYDESYTLVIPYAHQMGYTDSKTSNLSPEENALKNIAEHLDSIRMKL